MTGHDHPSSATAPLPSRPCKTVTSLAERPYPIRPAAEVDPTGAFERAYLEVAGMSETELSPHREHPLARHAPSSGEAEPRRIASTFENATAEELVRHPSPSDVNAEVVAALEGIQPAIDALRNNQRQLDADGVQVGVSRQALEEVLSVLAALQAQAAASGAGEMEICPDCNGSGEYADWGGTCPLCGGSGASLAPTEPAEGR